MFILHRISNKPIIPASISGATWKIFVIVTVASEPMSQNTMPDKVPRGSALYWISETNPEKNDPTIIPESIKPSVGELLYTLLSPYVAATESKPKEKAQT